MKHLRLTLSLSLILFTFLGSIPKINATPVSKASVNESDADEDDAQSVDAVKNGLQFRLSEGTGQPEHKDNVNLAPATRLSESEVQSVIHQQFGGTCPFLGVLRMAYGVQHVAMLRVPLGSSTVER